MKNISYMCIIASLMLISWQLTAQACQDTCDEPTPYETYRCEIEERLSPNRHPWLKWDGTKGGFNCSALLATIEIELTDSNFVILNDKDYYDASGKNADRYGGTLRNRSHWPKAYFDYPKPINGHDPSKKFFLLTPGDYRDYENLLLYNGYAPPEDCTHPDDCPPEKKYILYYDGPTGDGVTKDMVETYFRNHLCDTGYNPINRPDKQAIIERFYIRRGNTQDPSEGYWAICGITMKGNHYSYPGDNGETQTGGIFSEILGSNNVIWSCLFQNITGTEVTKNNGGKLTYGAHFIQMSNTDNNIIAECTFSDKNECLNASDSYLDMIGIFLKGSIAASSNNIIIGNYMTDVGDAIQLMPSNYTDATTMGAPGTLIYDNYLYNEKFYAVRANEENDGPNCLEERMNGEGAIDLKMGAGPWGSNSTPLCVNEKVIIANNIIHGWRRGLNGTGGNGDAIHMHSNAKNIVVIDNEISDCKTGISIGANSSLNEVVEHIEVYGNKIYKLYPESSNYDSSCRSIHSKGILINNSSAKVIDNQIKNSVHGLFVGEHGNQAEIKNNHVESIYMEWFQWLGLGNDFQNNTYVNFGDVCSSSDVTEGLLSSNCFLCSDRVTTIDSEICSTSNSPCQ